MSPAAAAERKAACDVRDYGTRGDGLTLDTAAIQRAIDACAAAGGGEVCFPPGRYLSGTLYLKDGVVLRLEAGSTLLGSRDLNDYPATVPRLRSYTDNYTDKSLIYGEGLQRVGIVGMGAIDGQGAAFKGPYKRRPYILRLVSCRDVQVRDVTFRDSPMWVQHYLACRDVSIRGITVRSHANANNDGLDIDSCQRVTVSDCNIDSQDDAIVLKSTLDRPCRDVAISNCILRSRCNALKMGTESNGGFQNVVVANCSIRDTGLAGLALEIVDGGTMDRLAVSNLAMDGVGAPIFIRLGDRGRPFAEGRQRPPVGRLRNVTISSIRASGAGPVGCAISGLPGHPIERLTLAHVQMTFAGGAEAATMPASVPEHAGKYPEFGMFGRLPAYGLYCRHVRGLRMVNVELDTVKPDGRPPVVFDDVTDAEMDSMTVRDLLRHRPTGPPASGPATDH